MIFRTVNSRLVYDSVCLLWKYPASTLTWPPTLKREQVIFGKSSFLKSRSIKTSAPRCVQSGSGNGSTEETGSKADEKEQEKEDTALSEIITIYERMTKSQPQDTPSVIYRPSKHGFSSGMESGTKLIEEELVSLVPTFDEIAKISKLQQEKERLEESNMTKEHADLHDSHSLPSHNVLDFSKYKNMELNNRYIFFSADTDMIQSNTLNGLSTDYASLLKSNMYWLNILNPTEEDIRMLHTSFNVHDLTLSDIRTPNSEEKIEIFKHYVFVSLKLMPSDNHHQKPFDNDFNVLLFKDFAITLHNTEWAGVPDILGFLNLLCNNTSSQLAPYWILFSTLTELKQDAKDIFEKMEPEINQVRIASKTMMELSDVMTRIFDMEFKLYILTRFIKPKMNILRLLETKYDKRLNKRTEKLVRDIHDDLKEMSHEMEVFSHILERSQDTVLGLVNVERSKEANDSTRVMNRLSQIAIVFLPVQAVAGFFGMNVQVPFQHEGGTTIFFWLIIGTSILLGFTAYGLRNIILRSTLSPPNWNRWTKTELSKTKNKISNK